MSRLPKDRKATPPVILCRMFQAHVTRIQRQVFSGRGSVDTRLTRFWVIHNVAFELAIECIRLVFHSVKSICPPTLNSLRKDHWLPNNEACVALYIRKEPCWVLFRSLNTRNKCFEKGSKLNIIQNLFGAVRTTADATWYVVIARRFYVISHCLQVIWDCNHVSTRLLLLLPFFARSYYASVQYLRRL